MPASTLSRQERRTQIAKAAKLYGIKGEESLTLHHAYNALARHEVAEAVQMVLPITRSHPGNIHAWIIMGGAALEKREGKTAQAFFGKAAEKAPRNSLVLAGQAKAHVLEAEVEEAVARMAEAFANGSTDAGLANLYAELMAPLGRRLKCVEVLEPVVSKLKQADLSYKLATLLTDADEPGRAARWFETAYSLDPKPEKHRIGQLRALVYTLRFDAAEELAAELLPYVQNRDEVVGLQLILRRVQRRYDDVISLADSHEFTDPSMFAQSRGILANVWQDKGEMKRADDAYVEAINITGEQANVAKGYGVFLYRGGHYAKGAPYYAQRLPQTSRNRIPYENSEAETLLSQPRLHLMGEQGIGDQLALLSLLRLAPLAEGVELNLVSDPRFAAALEGNSFGIKVKPQDDFLATPQQLRPSELVFLGDLSRYLDGRDPAEKHGPYLRPDPARVAKLREKYAARAKGAPVIGMAWNSGSLIGYLRSLPLVEMMAAVPEGAVVVNLQYGDCRAALTAAAKARPDVTFIDDREVDQMADLAAFFAQIAAVDRVITIDNTTAHACGAIGHPDAHVLIPAGSECMWYWGDTGEQDPWYGNLSLHRQQVAGDWASAIATLAGNS
ncbi:hypothetical protein [Pseudooceanicola nanhaiensis]|uniref:hypothetical protein n=1 Tax=Pseudooceanicola nanhaiensis TaxID=375761 RepID=UPI001CD80F37|nr:hypothetical protein [Pseudooceanicola nanhaiensis]MCA0922606.1 hypothetical protein [Pseudooceanicola nanhaiensis]